MALLIGGKAGELTTPAIAGATGMALVKRKPQAIAWGFLYFEMA
jgi:hypothetical protein